MKSDYIFISYSSKDNAEVNRILDMLKTDNCSYWKAPEMIPVGSNYAKEIPKAISECKVFLLVLSDNSQNSIWVEKEIDYAVNARCNIIPVDIDGTPLNHMFKFYLNNVQTIQYYNNTSNGLKAIRDAISQFITNDNTVEPAITHWPKKETIAEKKSGANSRRSIGIMTPGMQRKVTKALPRIEAIPTCCNSCGHDLIEDIQHPGNYICSACGKVNFESFKVIKELLRTKGAMTMDEIHEQTGISKKLISYFIKNDMLETINNNSITKYPKS